MNDSENSTNDIKNDYNKNGWNDTIKKWVRRCPNCNKDLFYSLKYDRNTAIRRNSTCRSCSISGKNHPLWGTHCSDETKKKMRIAAVGKRLPAFSDEHRKRIREAKLGISRSEQTKKKISDAHIGKHLSEDHKKKIGDAQRGNPRPPISDTHRRKLRVARIKQVERDYYNGNQIMPSYNPNACKLIDEYGKKNSYNFQHAMNGGEFHIKELGYFVDGYDNEKNVVIEYYENRHRSTIKRDTRRKQEIINHLNCKFIELKEWENYIE